MPTCDLCSTPIDGGGRRVSPEVFRAAVQAGLRPPEGMLEAFAFGQSAASALQGWAEMVMTEATDWVLCPVCAPRLDQHTNAGPSPLPAASAAPAPPSWAAQAKAGDADPLALLREVLKTIGGSSPIPVGTASLVTDLDRQAERFLKTETYQGGVGLAAIVAGGVLAGSASNSGWIALLGSVAAFVVFIGLAMAFEAIWIRFAVAPLIRHHAAPYADAAFVFKRLVQERRLVENIRKAVASLQSKPLSSDMAKRIGEAIVLALLPDTLQQVLPFSRDLDGQRAKLEQFENAIKAAKGQWTPVVGVGERILIYTRGLLNNREKLLQTLDVVAALKA